MKLNLTNPNYCATVIEVKSLIPLDNCDNLVWLPIFWYQAIVSKEVKIWDVWIIFTAEVILSEDYCKNNNLYRHSELNIDPQVKWYMEDNRRVKAMKFRWNKSSALFMPLSSLNYWSYYIDDLKVWDNFNEIDWIEICTKYIPKIHNAQNRLSWKTKKFERIDNKTFPEHIDTDNYFRNMWKYKHDDMITITQKLHWTSWRFWYVKVRKKLNWIERLLNKYINIDQYEYDYIAWSRRVIKDAKSESEFNHYYNDDVWNKTLEDIKSVIPKDYILYWEIIGYVWDKPIQKWYTYTVPVWENKLYIYRISIVNQDWIITDLDYYSMREFCKNNWLNYVPLLWEWKYKDLNIDCWLDRKFYTDTRGFNDRLDNPIKLADESPCDEWVVVRKDWLLWYYTKAKSPIFLEFESDMLDKWEEDIEQEQSLDINQI